MRSGFVIYPFCALRSGHVRRGISTGIRIECTCALLQFARGLGRWDEEEAKRMNEGALSGRGKRDRHWLDRSSNIILQSQASYSRLLLAPYPLLRGAFRCATIHILPRD